MRILTQVNKTNTWQRFQILLVGGIVVTTGIIVWQLVRPLHFDDNLSGAAAGGTVATADVSGLGQPEPDLFQKVAEIVRPGLFKSETPLSDKPMADQTIERIRSQLKLQCIMELDGELVAYVRIKGEGMKKFKIGDICDLFTVLDIDKKSIVISIVGHKTVLSF